MPKSHATFGGAITPLSIAEPTLVLEITAIEDVLDVGEGLLQSLPLHFWQISVMLPKTSLPRLRRGKGFSLLTCCSTCHFLNTSRDKALPVLTRGRPSARFGFKPACKRAGGHARALATRRRAPQGPRKSHPPLSGHPCTSSGCDHHPSGRWKGMSRSWDATCAPRGIWGAVSPTVLGGQGSRACPSNAPSSHFS